MEVYDGTCAYQSTSGQFSPDEAGAHQAYVVLRSCYIGLAASDEHGAALTQRALSEFEKAADRFQTAVMQTVLAGKRPPLSLSAAGANYPSDENPQIYSTAALLLFAAYCLWRSYSIYSKRQHARHQKEQRVAEQERFAAAKARDRYLSTIDSEVDLVLNNHMPNFEELARAYLAGEEADDHRDQGASTRPGKACWPRLSFLKPSEV